MNMIDWSKDIAVFQHQGESTYTVLGIVHMERHLFENSFRKLTQYTYLIPEISVYWGKTED